MKGRLLFSAALIVATMAGDAFGQRGSTTTVHVDVSNDNGQPLVGAHVVIHWEPLETPGFQNVGVRANVVGSTDRDGRFTTELPQGFYDVFVAWQIAAPYSKKVRVELGKPFTHTVSMNLEPQLVPFVFHPVPES